jgi:aspartyl-tRNA(Asn)/glutamyl-tRNA(Gln) amidotransferase subunit A
MKPLHELTIAEARTLLDKREFSSVELTQAYLDRITAVEDKVHSFLSINADIALEQARAADANPAQTPLHGIPLAIKDVISTKGIVTTCASKMLETYNPPYDATVVSRLKNAGAVTLGKTNCDEFAMGSSTENSAYVSTRNPWDIERVPGGSSGGSASVVAAAQALGSLGTDTGGSIRQPAAYCGITGLKPTYGRVSRYGVVAFASSLDQVGPMTRTARDAAMMLSVIAGHDPQDGTSSPEPVADYLSALTGDVRGLRIGVPSEYFIEGLNQGVEASIRGAIKTLQDAGAEIVEISLPHTKYALPVYYIIAPAEASANLARFDGVRYGTHKGNTGYWEDLEQTRGENFGPEVRRRIMLGTYALSAGYYDAYYRRAQQVRTLIRRDFQAAFEKVDVIATPTAPSIAFRFGDHTEDPLSMYLEDIFTLPTSLAGLPGLAVPCGFTENMPVGLQLIGRPFDEATLLRTGDAYQQLTDWHTKLPTIA